ncbi:MAG: hypothetical protein ACQEW8_08435 [Actinomycetota bacterium]
MNTEAHRARTAFIWVGVVVPLSIIVFATLIGASWLPEIPTPAALHWFGGGVDTVGPAWGHLVLLAGLGGGLVLGLGALVWFGLRSTARADEATGRPAGWPVAARFLGAVNLGLAVLLSVITLTALGVQRGLEDASDAPAIGGAVLLGVALMLVCTALGWFLQPKVSQIRPAASGAEPMSLAPGERAIWMGTATIARGGQVVFALALSVEIALVVILLLTGAGGTTAVVITGGAGLLILVMFAATFIFRVRAGAAGLRVRSALGWPRVEIPASDIRSARSMHLEPFVEFGGWGLRYAPDGRYGVVLRAGEALEVTRSDGRTFFVTVDDAATAASVLVSSASASEGPRS